MAVFGPGDSQWEEFCEAVNLLESKLQECNANLIAPGFKWDGESMTKPPELSKNGAPSCCISMTSYTAIKIETADIR